MGNYPAVGPHAQAMAEIMPRYGYSDEWHTPQYYLPRPVEAPQYQPSNAQSSNINHVPRVLSDLDETWIIESLGDVLFDPDETWTIESLGDDDIGTWNSLNQDITYVHLSEETISEHLKTRVPEAKNKDENELCAICLDSLFQEDDKIVTLGCRHEYHMGCIKNWLVRKNRCPLCQATAIPGLQQEKLIVNTRVH